VVFFFIFFRFLTLDFYTLQKRTLFRIGFLVDAMSLTQHGRTQICCLTLHLTLSAGFASENISGTFFFAFEFFLHAQFVSIHCRLVSDIKTYMTIIMLRVLVVTCMVSIFSLSLLPVFPSSVALPGPAEEQSRGA